MVSNYRITGEDYRGYQIFTDKTLCWIKKHGHFVCWASNPEDAQRKIDVMVTNEKILL